MEQEIFDNVVFMVVLITYGCSIISHHRRCLQKYIFVMYMCSYGFFTSLIGQIGSICAIVVDQRDLGLLLLQIHVRRISQFQKRVRSAEDGEETDLLTPLGKFISLA